MLRRWLGCGSFAFLVACNGSTGSGIVSFDAAAAGPTDAHAGDAYRFTNGLGYDVSLEQARLHVGAVYLNRSVPIAGGQETSCVLPGIYVGEVTNGRDVDVLSPEPQPFPAPAEGTADRAATAQVWLFGTSIDAQDDPTIILSLRGVATKDGATFPFDGTITIGKNRKRVADDPSRPGANPLCRERIVTPIPVDFVPQEGGHVVLRVDPKVWLAGVDFAALDQGDDGKFHFRDDANGAPSIALYDGLRSRDAYAFEWTP